MLTDAQLPNLKLWLDGYSKEALNKANFSNFDF
jgi:hypothetical protein